MTNAPHRPVVLDAEGISRLVKRDAYIQAVVDQARRERVAVVTSAATLVEVAYPRMNLAAFRWAVSRLRIEPVTKEISVRATELLAIAGLHGHRHALDAILCATALRLPGHSTIYTSDPTDIRRLVGGSASVVPLR